MASSQSPIFIPPRHKSSPPPTPPPSQTPTDDNDDEDIEDIGDTDKRVQGYIDTISWNSEDGTPLFSEQHRKDIQDSIEGLALAMEAGSKRMFTAATIDLENAIDRVRVVQGAEAVLMWLRVNKDIFPSSPSTDPNAPYTSNGATTTTTRAIIESAEPPLSHGRFPPLKRMEVVVIPHSEDSEQPHQQHAHVSQIPSGSG
jgi:hypothetical protein